MPVDQWIGLTEAIQTLRAELVEARRLGDDQSLHFDVGPVVIELALVARREAGGKAGVQFGVVALGVDGGVAREEVHRVTVTLQPHDPTTGRSPRVSAHIDSIPAE